jgi:hypothetical protein
VAALRYQRPIVDYYNYNVLYLARQRPGPAFREIDEDDRLIQVGDKKVAFDVLPARASRGWVGAEIRTGGLAFQARLTIGDGTATLRRIAPTPDPDRYRADREAVGGDAFTRSADAGIKPDFRARIELEVVDCRAALRMDGKELVSIEYDDGGEPPRTAAENGLWLLAADGAECNFEAVRVWRDVFYTDISGRAMSYAVHGRPVRLGSGVGADEYFACGDNSPASSDGRFWGPIPARNMMGRALLVFWPLWPLNWQFKMIR